jgi:selenocysteine lyase/cysteine desulfurase
VDGAQMVAHMPTRMSGHDDPARDIDVLVFSGHKIYAPGSPGVVVARKSLFDKIEPVEVGGGMVDEVWVDRYTPTARLPDREEAGTPNIPGAIGLAAALSALDRIGMDLIFREECELIHYALDKLRAISGVEIYGETDINRCQRAGAISFNIHGVHHALTAAVLNDYFGIAVRNECFCAHPYVREMITEALAKQDDNISIEELERLAELQRGMVRASFGIYNTRADVDGLAAAVADIANRGDFFESAYTQLDSGDFAHKSFRFEPDRLFSIERGSRRGSTASR